MTVRIARLVWTVAFFLLGGSGVAYAQAEARRQIGVETRVITIPEKGLEELGQSSICYRIDWATKHGIESALLDDVKLLRLLETVQGDRRGHIIQLPKYTIFDGQEATAAGTIEAKLRPTISADGRYVTLQARVSCRQGSEFAQTGNNFSLAVSAKVPDRHTIAITAGTKTIESRVESPPSSAVARIPYVNRLFRSVGYNRETVKVVVLLTPLIVRDEEAADVRPLVGELRTNDSNAKIRMP